MNVQQIALSQLVPNPRNPRRYFDPAAQKELEDSLRAQGFIQFINARPLDDGRFEIIAGERRWRAAKKVYGDDGEVPVIVRKADDDEADTLALTENTVRDDMSATEEADAAARILYRFNGDKAETIRHLGWSPSKFNSRMALHALCDEVKDALNARQIQLGHAELLATLPHDKQRPALEKIVQHGLSIAYVKEFIARVTHELAGAIFDKAACSSCAYNSAQQRTLFAEALDDGRCTNGQCFDGKTQAHLEKLREALAEEGPVARIVGPGEEQTYVTIQSEGAMGVGQAQFEQGCKGCAHFGGAVSGAPDTLGQVMRGLCFDPACNAKKVAARIKAEKTPTAPEPGKASGAATAEKTAKPAAPATGAVTNAVKDYRIGVWKGALKKELVADPDRAQIFLVSLGLRGYASKVRHSTLGEILKKIGQVTEQPSSHGGFAETLAVVAAQSENVRSRMLTAMSVTAVDDLDARDVQTGLDFMQADLARHWNIDPTFLKLLTKSEIEATAREIGLAEHLGDKFTKIMGGKKDDAIAALMAAEGFAFDGRIPAAMQFTTH